MYGKFVNGTSTNSAKCGVSIAAFLCYSLCNINHDDNNYNNNNNNNNNKIMMMVIIIFILFFK